MRVRTRVVSSAFQAVLQGFDSLYSLQKLGNTVKLRKVLKDGRYVFTKPNGTNIALTKEQVVEMLRLIKNSDVA